MKKYFKRNMKELQWCTNKQAVIVTVLVKAGNVVVRVLVIINVPAINKQMQQWFTIQQL